MHAKLHTQTNSWTAWLLFTIFLVSVITSGIQGYKQETEFVQKELLPSHTSIVEYSEIELLRKLTTYAGSEGDFRGTITQEILPNNDLQITIHDDYAPDDSLGVYEQRFIAKKQDGKFTISQYYMRISCHRYPHIWQELLYIFIDPLWTKGSCG